MSGASPVSGAGEHAVSVDAEGVRLSRPADAVVDVRFDGRRVWSFWPRRDGQPDQGPEAWLVPWPRLLRPFLGGVALVTVARHAGEVLWEGMVSFPPGEGRVSVADREGHPLGIDSSGRLVRTFEFRGEEHARPVLDALETVLRALAGAGVPAFPAYGTLLGAFREGALIGHDSDTDVAYLSAHSHPVDVIRESFRLERLLRRLGFEITRYSGAGFKVELVEVDGTRRGLDVFAGFLFEGDLVLMGEIVTPFRPEWLLPLGTVVLEGRTLPAPAEPERLLEATYGPSWRVPDPAFSFTTPDSTVRRLNRWFRGTRVNRSGWDRRWALARNASPRRRAHDLVVALAAETAPETTVIDVGCGRGQDVFWLAQQGRRCYGVDFSSDSFEWLANEAAEQGLPVAYHSVNLLELRQVLGFGARLAQEPGRRAMMARHVLDSTAPVGREHLWRLASMLLRGGDRLYLDVVSDLRVRSAYGPSLLRPVDAGELAAQAAHRGGRVLRQERVAGEAVDLGYGPEKYVEDAWEVTRMVVEFR